MNSAINTIDYVIILVYFLIVFGIGFAVARRTQNGRRPLFRWSYIHMGHYWFVPFLHPIFQVPPLLVYRVQHTAQA